MKMKAALFVTCLVILANSSVTFADCGSGQCYKDDSSYCDSESPCACTDPGYRYNDCISKSEFCEAFGNDGAI